MIKLDIQIFLRAITVVSTVMSGILFACFPTVDYVTTAVAFFYDVIIVQKKVPVDSKSFGKGKSVKIREKKINRKQSLSLTHCAVVSNTHLM